MTQLLFRGVSAPLLVWCLLMSSVSAYAAGGDPLGVAATPEHVVVTLPGAEPSGKLEAQRVDQRAADEWTVLHDGAVGGDRIQIERAGQESDPLYHRYRWTAAEGVSTGFVTDVSQLPSFGHAMDWPIEVKGVSCPVNLSDLAELGAAHTHINIIQRMMLLGPEAADPPAEFIREVDGVRLRFNPRAIRDLDRKVSELTRFGVNVVAVFLNRVPDEAGLDDPMRHPASDVEGAPFNLCAFNTTTPEGIAHFRGVLGFLAERYSQPAAEHGTIGGWIIGNEVDSHWTWHNLGAAPMETIATQYIDEMRLAWLAVREVHPELPVFVSLTHSWTRPNSLDSRRNVAGKAFLERLVELADQDGNFDFNVAHHPYPENLRDPRFWEDRTAWFAYDTPRITYKNFEVLSSFLHKPHMLVEGQPRRLIFSEQGLDTPEGSDGEAIQAAAYALSYERIAQVPHVEAYILHRHVDTRHEFGLRLGLWSEKPEPAPAETPDRRKQSWYVFQAAGTDGWSDATRFAFPILGIESWSDAKVKTGPFPEVSETAPTAAGNSEVLFNLINLALEAEHENVMKISDRIIPLANGGIARGLFVHPPQPDEGVASVTYTLDLPRRQGLALVFQTHVHDRTRDGVIFSVEVNGRTRVRREAMNSRLQDHRVSLSQYAGRTVQITLKVDPKKNNSHDWATFVSPLIVANPQRGAADSKPVDVQQVSR
ncbi:MAG: DUF5722 domain-containing protein [Planctomycetota bacterium]